MDEVLARASRIKLVIFDVDGVLTDGTLFLGDDGLEYKGFYSRDGHGIKMLQETGVHIAVITGRTSKVVQLRMESLGIQHIYQGRLDKLGAYEDLAARIGVTGDQVAYAGDDIMDLPVMRRVGLAVAVQDAHPLVVNQAHWQTPSSGGRGAARDVCELIMEAQGTLQAQLQQFLV